MELAIKWTDFSKKELYKIFDYYKTHISLKTAKKIVKGITSDVNILINHPEVGQIEELLKEHKENFRFLLSKRNYKIIYWINSKNNTIEIVDVFDVRQNPVKMNKER